MSKKDIILIGGGGHCVSCIDVIESTGEYNIAGVVDVKSNIGKNLLGYKYIGCDDDLIKLKEKYQYAIITVGYINESLLRKRLFELVQSLGYIIPVIISPNAYISRNTVIGKGTIVMHQSVLNSGVKVGDNNIINTKSLLEHDTVLGNHNHISTNVIVNGNVIIGNECFLGSSTVINNNITLQDNIIIGSSSNVRKNIFESGVYVGNPIVKIR
tara:strand:- start:219 stop:857 length:639 start_codon:yes stop_codon:yes gene_type:complete